MKKIVNILILAISAAILLTMTSCNKKEVGLKEGESYAYSPDGLYRFTYVPEDYMHVNFVDNEATLIAGKSAEAAIEVMTVVETDTAPSADGLDELCTKLPLYEKYQTFFEDFDFSGYETIKLNKMENVRYYEKHMEAEDVDNVTTPTTTQVYIFAGEKAYYVITAGYLDYNKEAAEKYIKTLLDTFEERTQEGW